ncbi:uncharacterized protein K452DRAFT_284743 [Aplosporella prunicola CBS 121167]|uniref:N-acetyltransferase domain-containing protein n=1 Tax=Aplosporella prunicola CBS 121167 TaxID=1176127 RepID=A0A6A6BK54_9PEZI|nr:uncharacterized protein K452DRAFT_284743 [Aplosporella prunicola CBS 121167]KAF2144426.1 hypothetical protein K452DRAFT_284743 [Aplosporella prunicola CBS 121167]
MVPSICPTCAQPIPPAQTPPPPPEETLQSTTTPEAPFPPTPIVTLPNCTIRPYHPRDIPSLALHANNPNIAKWMTNLFPTPYTLADSEHWVMMNVPKPSTTSHTADSAASASTAAAEPPPASPAAEATSMPDVAQLTYPPILKYVLALPETSTAIGTIDIRPGGGNESHTAEIGYWVGEAYWGRGIASGAVRAFVEWAFAAVPGLERIFAHLYDENVGSATVLKRAGLVWEGKMRRAAIRMGRYWDMEVYGVLREEVMGVKDGV